MFNFIINKRSYYGFKLFFINKIIPFSFYIKQSWSNKKLEFRYFSPFKRNKNVAYLSVVDTVECNFNNKLLIYY